MVVVVVVVRVAVDCWWRPHRTRGHYWVDSVPASVQTQMHHRSQLGLLQLAVELPSFEPGR